MKLRISSHKLSIETGLPYDNVPSDKKALQSQFNSRQKIKDETQLY